MNGRAVWLPSVLRLAGIEVITHPGWETRSNGDFTNLRAVVWHHDASPAGDSPGVPAYMIRNYGNAGAQLWVDRRGVWHVVGAGVAYHAGKVLPGKPGNWDSLGVETDHTTGEAWPPTQLDSLRRGTAAILRHLGVGPTGLEFHRTVCSPPGRKSDPAGLDLITERRAIAALLAPPAQPVQEDDMERRYEVVTVPAVWEGRQAVAVPGYRFDRTGPVSIKANDNGLPVAATVQSWGYEGALMLTFVGIDAKPVPAGKVGVLISYRAA